MYIRVNYESDFEDLLFYLRSKYNKRLFNLDGIGEEQLDMSSFSKNFFASSVAADVSIDANANVSDMNMIVYNAELPKPFFRLNSYFLLWKELKRIYSLEVANSILEQQISGDIYINDAHNVQLPYCWNYSCYDVALLGLPMVSKIKSVAPKHIYSFKSQIEQFVIIAANSTLGATGIADFLIVMAYYVDKALKNKKDSHFTFATEEDVWTYVKESLASFIYIVNQPNRAQQSAFTNISIFDDYFLDKLLPDYNFISDDGKTVNPNKNTVKKLQEMFLDCMNEEMKRTPITFPVTTACFSVTTGAERNIQDEEFANFIAEKNLAYGFINIYTGETSTLSSCCFKGDETIRVKNKETGLFEIMTLETFVKKFISYGEKTVDTGYTIESLNKENQEVEECDIIGVLARKNEHKKLIKITCNKKELQVTPDHIFLVKDLNDNKIKEISALEISKDFKRYLLPID